MLHINQITYDTITALQPDQKFQRRMLGEPQDVEMRGGMPISNRTKFYNTDSYKFIYV